jgi:hypothetical protein
MNKLFSGFTTVAAVAFVIASPAISAAAPIAIQQCFVTVPKHFSQMASGTQITYVNTGRKTATRVTFAVAYRNASSRFLRRVSDDGSFAPGTTIDHHFSLYNDVTYAGKHASCQVVAVRWADGTVWRY